MTEPGSGPLRLRVLTYNIHGGRPERSRRVGLRAIADVVLEAAPDLAAFQEVHQRMPPPGVPQDQPARLRSVLGMEVTFRPSFSLGPGVGYGNALASRVPPTSVALTRLPDRMEPRSVLEAEFDFHGRKVRVLNTHVGLTRGQHPEQFARIAARVAAADGPLILMGDFNIEPDNPELQRLLDAGLTHAAPPHVLTFPTSSPTRRLDYILVSSHFTVEGWDCPLTVASDHLPLVADLILT